MNRDRFDHLLEAYGADFARWPESEREAARTFAAAHERELAPSFNEARALDDLLGEAFEAVATSELLTARVIANARKTLAPTLDWRPLAALAACAVFGVALGFGGGLMAPTRSDPDAVLASVFGGYDLGEEG